MIITATYDPADNRLRLRADARLDRAIYDRLRAAGYMWAPKQELFVAPMWTPEREDLAIELAGEIGDEDTSLVDRAEDRAGRFEAYQEKRADEARAAREAVAAVADKIPLGQPILVGHHSERRARKDADRIQNGMRQAVRLWDTSEYWRRRAAGALRHAKYKETPAVRHRRIKTIEADRRRHVRAIDDAEGFRKAWLREGLTEQQAIAIANYDHHTVQEEGKSHRTSLWSMLTQGRMTAEAVRDVAVDLHDRAIDVARRWLAHLDNRLAYERVMLADAGGVVTDHYAIEIGGRVLAMNRRSEAWLVVLKINRVGNKDRAGSPVTSLTTTDGVVQIEDVKGYRPPEDGAAAAVKAASKLPPIVNYPSDGCREMTKAEWDQRSKHSSGFYRLARIAATDTVGGHRRREAPIPGGGGWNTQFVYLTDAKRVDPPALAADHSARPAEIEPEVVGRAARRASTPRPEEEEAFDALREQSRAGVQVVSAPELFPSPPDVAALVVAAADVRPGQSVLEPSAGTGALLRALAEAEADVRVVAVEIRPELAPFLPLAPFTAGDVHRGDFLDLAPRLGLYDRVIANPPFSFEVEHMTTALDLLEPGGKLVAIMSAGVKFRADRKYSGFRDLVAQHGGTVEDLPDGSFRASGTDVRTVLVQITRGPA